MRVVKKAAVPLADAEATAAAGMTEAAAKAAAGGAEAAKAAADGAEAGAGCAEAAEVAALDCSFELDREDLDRAEERLARGSRLKSTPANGRQQQIQRRTGRRRISSRWRPRSPRVSVRL